jgi:hypothetical protein
MVLFKKLLLNNKNEIILPLNKPNYFNKRLLIY